MLLMTAGTANAGGLVTKHASSVQLTVDAARATSSRIGSSFSISGSNIATTDGTTAGTVSAGTISSGVYSPGTIAAVQGTDEESVLVQSVIHTRRCSSNCCCFFRCCPNFSSVTSYAAGSAGDLAGTVNSDGVLTVTAGGGWIYRTIGPIRF